MRITRHLTLQGGRYHLKYKKGNMVLESWGLPSWKRTLEMINYLDRIYEGLM